MPEIDKGFNAYRPYSSKCSQCKHFDSVEFTCTAYPVGIPSWFLSGQKEHLTVQRDQKGTVVFTAKS